MNVPRSKTTTLIEALRILARDIQSDDGVANTAITEAADRMEELLELVDGAYDFVDLYGSDTWKDEWIEKASDCGANPSP